MDEWYFQGYFWLCSERLFQYGPIPWSARMLYADTYGLTMDTAVVFAIVITKIDAAYWAFEVDKREKEKKAKGRDVKRGKAKRGYDRD